MSAANREFFDTNILLYIHGSDLVKRERAARLFKESVVNGRILLSTQVVQEFYAAGLRKLSIPSKKLREAISALLDLPVVLVNGSHILAAIANLERHKISFWDGLILAAAEAGGAEVLYTEDLNNGQRYGAVVARNPFLNA